MPARKGTIPFFVTVSVILSTVIAGLFLVLHVFMPVRVLSRFALRDEILPISITVYGRGSDTISARLALYTADWTVLNTVERSWPGWEISIEALVIQSGTGNIVFPLTVRTDETRAGQGIPITRYYDRSDFPALYERIGISSRERSALRRLFFLARHGLWVSTRTGRFRQGRAVLREFQTGTEYFLFVDRSGRLSFR